jgi:iron uptake system component EfeO
VPAGVRSAVCGLLSATVLAAGLAACGSSRSGNVISVSTGTCGTGWHDVRAGMQTFQLHNTSTAGAEVDLINPASGAIYAEVEQLGAGTTRPLRVNLGPGRYAFRCLLEDTTR